MRQPANPQNTNVTRGGNQKGLLGQTNASSPQPDLSNSKRFVPQEILRLQRLVGNAALQRMILQLQPQSDNDAGSPSQANGEDVYIQRLLEKFAKLRKSLVTSMDATADDAQRRQIIQQIHELDVNALNWLRPYTAAQKPIPYPSPDAQDAVLAALQLSAVFGAEQALGNDASSEKASQGLFGMTGQDWCGMFAAFNYTAQGLDSDLKKGFLHVLNVEEYFTYRHQINPERVPKWVWATDPADGVARWMDIKDYHSKRSSTRTWIDAEAIHDGRALDIRPGDIVVLDYGDPSEANHIVMVQSYDKTTKTLFTIGGNDGGYTVDNNPSHTAPKRGSADARKEAVTGQPLKPGSGAGVGIGMQDLAKQPDPSKRTGASYAADKANPKQLTAKQLAAELAVKYKTRVYGIGRPSIVDFEQHFYDPSIGKDPPTKKPKGVQ